MDHITINDTTKQYDNIVFVRKDLDETVASLSYFVFVNKKKTESIEVSLKSVLENDFTPEQTLIIAENQPSWNKYKELLGLS